MRKHLYILLSAILVLILIACQAPEELLTEKDEELSGGFDVIRPI